MFQYFQWHLGFYAWQFTPTYRGFESHYGYLMGHGDYFDHMTECGPVRQISLVIKCILHLP